MAKLIRSTSPLLRLFRFRAGGEPDAGEAGAARRRGAPMLGQRQSHAADHVQSAGGRRHRGPALRRGVEGDGGAGQVEGPASDGQLYGGQRARRTTAHGRRQRHVRRHRSVCHAQSGVGTPLTRTLGARTRPLLRSVGSNPLVDPTKFCQGDR